MSGFHRPNKAETFREVRDARPPSPFRAHVHRGEETVIFSPGKHAAVRPFQRIGTPEVPSHLEKVMGVAGKRLRMNIDMHFGGGGYPLGISKQTIGYIHHRPAQAGASRAEYLSHRRARA